MIDIKQYLLTFKFKWIHKFFDDEYSAAWKTIESLCLKSNSFFTFLWSNCRINNMKIKNLLILVKIAQPINC